MNRLVLAIGLMYALPFVACAQVRVTEIMYNPPGSNAGAQWIEVTNMSDRGANLSGYRLAESGTNHKISVSVGTTTLAAHESLIISNGPDTFSAVYPQYHGTLLKSSFSLSASGETIALKDNTLATVDTVTYSSSWGGKEDGNTLHYTTSGFVAGAPDPGIYTNVPPAPLISQKSSAQNVSTKASKKAIPPSTNVLTHETLAPETAAAASASSTSAGVWWQWVAGLAGIATLVAALYAYLPRKETKALPEEFDFE